MENKKKQIIKISVFITSIFVIFMSVSYAFFGRVLNGNKKLVLSSGDLELVLEEENMIVLSDCYPIADEVGMIQPSFDFKIVNKSVNSTFYKIKLDKIATDDELSMDYVRYYLTKNGEGTPKSMASLSDDLILDEDVLEGNKTNNYSLRLWLDFDITDHTLVDGKSLSFKISVDTSQTIELVLSEKIAQKVDLNTNIDFSKVSSATNGRGVYKYTEDDKDIYYYRGDVTDNHVVFGGYCWEIIRTTKTGGVKMIYDGVAVDNKCNNTGNNYIESTGYYFSSASLAYAFYMYGNTVYSYKNKASTDNILTTSGIKYGYDVNWDGSKYILKAKDGGSLFSSSGSWNTDRTSIKNYNHYTCFDTTDSCSKVYYIYYTGNSSNAYYIELTNGVTIDKALETMMKNEQSSPQKKAIDSWFLTSNLNDDKYLDMIDDAVYCNDRSIEKDNYGGWEIDGNSDNFFNYNAQDRLRYKSNPSLECENVNDSFTVDSRNGNGALTYPVAMITGDEVMLAGGSYYNNNSDFYLYIGKNYRTLTPYYYSYAVAENFYVSVWKHLGSHSMGSNDVIRPVITLKNKTKVDGIGTLDDPYVVIYE